MTVSVTFDDDDGLLLPQEAADYLRMKLQTLANWRCYGGGPEFTRVGNRVFYPMRRLKAFIRIYSSTSEYGKPAAAHETPTDGGGIRRRAKSPSSRASHPGSP
jgi:hypothetical protein